jgi:uncharacterized protein YcaQ
MLTLSDSMSNNWSMMESSTSSLLITNRQARKLFLERQGLSMSVRSKLSTDGLLEMIRALGFVQVDSINTVARAHHMILFARNQTYRMDQLTHLLETKRALFEHWTHDASVIPVEYFPYWRYRFVRDKAVLLSRWRKARHEGFEEIFEKILAQVRLDGPTMARDIGTKRKIGRGWWDWHPEKTALEFHWRTGNLAIAGRVGFQKIYDITEKVIPEYYREARVDEIAFVDWACRSALERLGMATSVEIAAFWDLVTNNESAEWCRDALASGTVMEVLVEGTGERKLTKAFAFPDLSERLGDLPEALDCIRVLSPFDPLIRDRKRCLRLFGFDYRIEIFIPEAKRQYGYYVFPLLEGDRFIGRIDMKHQKGVLTVTGFWLEPGVKMGKGRKAALEAELDRHRRFVGAESIAVNCRLD